MVDRSLSHPISTVSDGGDLVGPNPRRQMRLDLRVVRNQVIAQPAARPLIQPEPGLRHRPPLRAGPLNAIHVDDIRNALHPQQGTEGRRVVTQGQTKILMLRRVPDGLPVEIDRPRRSGAARREMDALNPLPMIGVGGGVAIFLAIDDDFPAFGDQVQRKVLGEGLEATVGGGDAADAEDADYLVRQTTVL